MIILKEHKKKLFQFQLGINPESGEYSEEHGHFLLDENNEMIPEDVCICFAHTHSECCCACSSCYAIDPKELNCLTSAIYFESRGESNLGQQLVGRVVLNRVEDPYFPTTICKVVYQKNQFSWTKDKKGSGRLLKGDLRGLNQKDRAAYLEAKIIALSLIKEGIEVPKKYKDVLFFVHTKVHRQQKWLTGLRFIGKVGSHRFYGNKGEIS